MMITAMALSTSTTMVPTRRMSRVFAPNSRETSSPRPIIVSERAITSAAISPAAKKGAERPTSSQMVLAELPAVYFIIALTLPDLRITAEETELNSVDIAMPESTIRSALRPVCPSSATP